jgi:ankyrin repeat protein
MPNFNLSIIICLFLLSASTHVRSTIYNNHAARSNPKSTHAQKVSECSANGRDSPSIRPPCGKSFGIPAFFKNETASDGDDSDEISDYILPASWKDNWESNNKLWIAARLGSVEDLESAISSGASVNAREAVLSRTALHFAAERGHTNVVLKLIAAGADIDARNEPNFTVVAPSGIELALLRSLS